MAVCSFWTYRFGLMLVLLVYNKAADSHTLKFLRKCPPSSLSPRRYQLALTNCSIVRV